MTRLRRVLAPVTALWLSCQLGTVALVPVALWITAADAHAAECTCGHGAAAFCRMHHKPTGGSSHCAMQAVDSSGIAVVTAFVGIAGPVAESTRSIQPPIPTDYPRVADAFAAGERPVPPDPPPPRA